MTNSYQQIDTFAAHNLAVAIDTLFRTRGKVHAFDPDPIGKGDWIYLGENTSIVQPLTEAMKEVVEKYSKKEDEGKRLLGTAAVDGSCGRHPQLIPLPIWAEPTEGGGWRVHIGEQE